MDFWQHRWNDSLQFDTACQIDMNYRANERRAKIAFAMPSAAEDA